MHTITLVEAEEELALAELALAELADAKPSLDNSDLLALEAEAENELAQLTARCQALVQAKYLAHRLELQEIKARHAAEINALFQENRDSKSALSSVLAEKKTELLRAKNEQKLAYPALLRVAKQRVKNAVLVQKHLVRRFGK